MYLLKERLENGEKNTKYLDDVLAKMFYGMRSPLGRDDNFPRQVEGLRGPAPNGPKIGGKF